MIPLEIAQARIDDPGVADVIARHFALMRAQSPEESCHVMPADALAREGATLIAARSQGKVLGIGALKKLETGHGEIKSMHTLAEARGKGVARAILRGLLEIARDSGMTRVSLETGSMAEFSAARALYATEGFTDCAPFGDYVLDPLSVFMTRTL